MQRMRALRAAATATTYILLDTAAQVEVESVSGDMDMHFLNADLTNAYRNLSNVVLALVPAAAASVPALLLGAHFDSTLDTPGASHSGVVLILPSCSCKRSFGPCCHIKVSAMCGCVHLHAQLHACRHYPENGTLP